MLTRIKHIIQGKHPASAKRSNKWPKVRAAHLAKYPTCAVCGGNKKLEAHHRRPFHLHPELELEETNLITLCESKHGGINCHLAIGHLGNFRSYNSNVEEDAAHLYKEIKDRP